MDLSDLQRLHDDYRVKARCLKRPARCAGLLSKEDPRREQIAALNGRLAAIPADEFRTFLAKVNRNPANAAFVAGRFERLQEVVAAEQRCLDEGRGEELARLLAEDVALFRQICREVRDHYARDLCVEVIGYGEITTSLVLSDQVGLDRDLQPQGVPSRWVYKSLPKFPSAEEVGRYERAFYEYSDLLRRAGIELPEQKLAIASRDAGGIKVYIVQRRLDSHYIGNVLIRTLAQPEALALLKKIVLKIAGVFAPDPKGCVKPFGSGDFGSGTIRLGFDGQISNWHCPENCPSHVPGRTPSAPTGWAPVGADAIRPLFIRRGDAGGMGICPDPDPAATMLYIDTSTPLYRVNGVEQINPEVFLKNTPSFMRAIIRRFFLQDVLDRYYDLRRVLIDVIANLYKEGRDDLIGPAVALVNGLLGEELRGFGLAPLTEKEVAAYYREDAFIWSFFQTARRVDRFVTEKVLRRRYPFRLPGKIKR